MDKLQKYHQVIQDLLMEEAHPYCQSDDVETVIICDPERHHYQLTYIGWEGDHRIFNLILHLDIKDGKIWVQHNGTEMAIGKRLMEQGVPASDIVLGFQSPFRRQFSGYAIT